MSSSNAPKPLSQTSEAQPQHSLIPNRRVLIVEDESAVAEAYRDILAPPTPVNVVPINRSSRSVQKEIPISTQPESFELVITYTAESALKAVREAVHEKKPFAMGFFDVLLGRGMDGIDLVKEIFKIDPDLHAVFVTAYSDRSVDAINETLGRELADRWDYLNKPFTEGEILQKARNIISLWNLRAEKKIQESHLAEMNRRLSASDRAHSIATISRGVAHEFGNLLVQIVGRAELSRNKPESEMRQAFDTILKATETATQILDKFKNIAVAEDAAQPHEFLWLHEPLETALQLVEHQLQTSNIKICRIKSDRIQTLANRTALTQVFLNLYINALQAMNRSGQIDISMIDEGAWARIIVRDYGPGIPDIHLQKIFDPFFTTKKTGTGLGLSICKEIIEMEHQGQFLVNNHSAKGAEFIIRLPVRKEDAT